MTASGGTREEHERILAAERNPERRLYYALLWAIGASQTDGALLTAENLDWATGTLSYRRQKTGSLACLTLGPRLAALLRSWPVQGPLFPRISATPANALSAELDRPCKLLGRRWAVGLASFWALLSDRLIKSWIRF